MKTFTLALATAVIALPVEAVPGVVNIPVTLRNGRDLRRRGVIVPAGNLMHNQYDVTSQSYDIESGGRDPATENEVHAGIRLLGNL